MNLLAKLLIYKGLTNKGGSPTPTGTIEITQNGTYDVKSYASADVNVQAQSEYNAKVLTNFTLNSSSNNNRLKYLLQKLPPLTFAGTDMYNIFNDCSGLVEAPEADTSSVTRMERAFNYCVSLTTIPLYNTSSLVNMNYCFSGCTALSDESLNNILAMCANATSYQQTKTLKDIGLSSTQATKCTTLSNWASAQSAGWTTGY